MLDQIDFGHGKLPAVSAHRLVFITSKPSTKEKQFDLVFEIGSPCEIKYIIFQISPTSRCTFHSIIKGQERVVDAVERSACGLRTEMRAIKRTFLAVPRAD